VTEERPEVLFGRDLATMRRIRDEIDGRVQKLVAELGPGP
jgi:hypothetical protein